MMLFLLGMFIGAAAALTVVIIVAVRISEKEGRW